MRREKGNDLVQYALPTLLVGVVFGLGLVYLVSSGDMTNFLMGSGNMKYDAASQMAIVGENSTLIAGYKITNNPDGSISFQVGDQQVTIPKQAIDYNNIAMETTGSSGNNDLVSMIADMINKHAGEYAPGQVPIEVAFGTSDKTYGSTQLTGSAIVNTTSVKVGNDLAILVKHQSCSNGCGNADLKQKITGQITGSGTFQGDMTVQGNYTEPFGGTVNTVGGGFRIDSDLTSGCSETDCYETWAIDFSDMGKNYPI